MPIYEYICNDCNQQFDALRSYKEADEPIPCDKCHGQHTSRKLSVFFAQSGGQVVAGGNTSGCSGCSAGTCAGCGTH